MTIRGKVAGLQEVKASGATSVQVSRVGDFLHSPLWLTVCVCAALHCAAFTHGEVFEATFGYRAVLTGVWVGIGVALFAAWWRVNIAVYGLLVTVAGLLFSACALQPLTSFASVLPSLHSLAEFLRACVTSWKDLLTVGVPLPASADLLVMPYISGLLCSAVAMFVAVRWHRFVESLIPVAILALLGILWGTTQVQHAMWIGLVGGVIILEIVARDIQRRDQSSQIAHLRYSGQRAHSLGWVLGTSAIVMALTSAFLVPFSLFGWADSSPRVVLRSFVEPPLDIRQLPSPTTYYRAWNTRDGDVELFVVRGSQSGRMKLASLDVYDGLSFRVSNSSDGQGTSSFRKVSDHLVPVLAQETDKLLTQSVSVRQYNLPWLVAGEGARQILRLSTDDQPMDEPVYYSTELSTLVSRSVLLPSQEYSVGFVSSTEWTDEALAKLGVATVELPRDSHVPQEVEKMAQQLAADADSDLDKIRAIERSLSTQGYYADGADGSVRPGHRFDRLVEFLRGEQLIGDDDQYAPAMVLMLRSLGIPARLAMGFLIDEPGSDQTVVHGRDVRMWVEVPFKTAGWVAFFPTPPKDRILRTEVPEPRPQAQPQVLQPPAPPEAAAELQAQEVPDFQEDDEEHPEPTGIPFFVSVGVGTVAFIALILGLIIGVKTLRTLHRRSKGSAQERVLNAWDELIDSARDFGIDVNSKQARLLQARELDAAIEERANDAQATVFFEVDARRTSLEELAQVIDEAAYGSTITTNSQASHAWRGVFSVVKELRAGLGWKKRIRAAVSLRSIASRWSRQKTRSKMSAHGFNKSNK